MQQFDDVPVGILRSYRGFEFPGVVDWFVVNPSIDKPAKAGRALPVPLHKGVASQPQALLSSFHWMTRFTGDAQFTFDIVSMYITALTAKDTPSQPTLLLKIWGFRPEDVQPSAKLQMLVRNAFAKDALGTRITLNGSQWQGPEALAIEAQEPG